MNKYILVAYEEIGYDITYEIEANSEEEAKDIYKELYTDGLKEIDSDFVGTVYREVTSIKNANDINET